MSVMSLFLGGAVAVHHTGQGPGNNDGNLGGGLKYFWNFHPDYLGKINPF